MNLQMDICKCAQVFTLVQHTCSIDRCSCNWPHAPAERTLVATTATAMPTARRTPATIKTIIRRLLTKDAAPAAAAAAAAGLTETPGGGCACCQEGCP